MTIDKNNIIVAKNEMVYFPKYLFVAILPILIGGIGGYATSRFNAGKLETRIEYHEKILEGKADRRELESIEKILIRMEKKWDDHIDNNK